MRIDEEGLRSLVRGEIARRLVEAENPESLGNLDSLDFKPAFKKARDTLGPGKTFTWKGEEYSTDYAPEKEGEAPAVAVNLPDAPESRSVSITNLLRQLYGRYDSLSERIIESISEDSLDAEIGPTETTILTDRNTGEAQRVTRQITVRQIIEREKPGGKVSKYYDSLIQLNMGDNLKSAVTKLSDLADQISEAESKFTAALKEDREKLGDYLSEIYKKIVKTCEEDVSREKRVCKETVYAGAIQMGKACLDWFQAVGDHPRFIEILRADSGRARKVQYGLWISGGFDPRSFSSAGDLARLYNSDPTGSQGEVQTSGLGGFNSMVEKISRAGLNSGRQTSLGTIPPGSVESF